MKKFYRVLFGVGLLVLAGCCRFPSRTSSEVQLRYTTEQKLWGLAASAVLTFRNEHDFFSLTGVIAGEPGKKEVQGALNGWDVESREDLLAVMKKVSEKGHRASYRAIKADLKRPPGERVWPSKDVSRVAFVQQHAEQLGDNALVGWDLSRLISLARWGVASGYLEENEAWEWIMPAAQEIQRTYSSWEDLGQSYLNGRRFWSAYHTRKDGYKYQRAVFWLLSNEHSPWKQLDWNLDLTGTHDLCADESVVPDTEGYYQVVRYYAQVDQYPILLSEVIKDPEESELSRGNAFNKLGDYYQYDWCGVGKNIRQAAEYYKEGAELGNAGCLYNLGRLHLFGTDCPKDYDQALMFFTRAEEQGSVRAILELGRLYEYGKG
ncbi:MAG: DUF1266 domain-containing protein, partial [Kiritimatiellales bacterium]|nr:DUF1266 domain-containing protein [Kiritimatiellales bacterium]